MTKSQMKFFRRRKARIMRLFMSGKPQAEIAQLLGMKRQRVYQIVRGK